MRVKYRPEDFMVEEQAELRLVAAGPWAVYRVRKMDLSTMEVQTRLAATLHLPRQRVIFPGLKDKRAVAEQYVTIPAGLPAVIEGDHFRAQYVGYRSRPLSPTDLTGNVFTLTLRDLADEAEAWCHRLQQLERVGLPNYFDEQRFGSFVAEGASIGKLILQRADEAALRAYLTESFAGDPRPVRAFKHRAAGLWPDWAALFAAAPRPSNYRSVLTYLIDHPQEYRRALNLVPARLLALYLAAYQSWLWNRISSIYVAETCSHQGIPRAHISVGHQELVVPVAPVPSPALATMRIPLPSHRADFGAEEVARIARLVLQEEGLELGQLKPRILKKAYLPSGERSLWLWPRDVSVSPLAPDEHFPGRRQVHVRFALPPGSYATLVLKVAEVALGQHRCANGPGAVQSLPSESG